MPEDKLAQKIAEVAAKDITGGCKIVDCLHPTPGYMLVITPENQMRLVMWADLGCFKCGQGIAHVVSAAVSGCPGSHGISCDAEYCPGHVFNGELRNYVIGTVPAVDRHLCGMGAFDAVLLKPLTVA